MKKERQNAVLEKMNTFLRLRRREKVHTKSTTVTPATQAIFPIDGLSVFRNRGITTMVNAATRIPATSHAIHTGSQRATYHSRINRTNGIVV